MISLQPTKLGRNGHANYCTSSRRIKRGDSSCVSFQDSSAVSKSSLSADAAPNTMRERSYDQYNLNKAAILSTDVASLKTSTNHIDSIETLDGIRRSHNIIIHHVPEKQDSASDDLTVRAIVDFLSPGSSQHIVATSRLEDAEKRMP
ncbi:hypothetical protein HHI36_019855 [Cryptolaemus montrouzieri]|uniref:Uncharacterized protein n=1 Tax=Cryptolaemus montrouzieri TaxID=559131 RepID=A0ABD2N8K6_9CUCU